MSELPAQRFLLEVIAILDRLQIPYMILGGFAVRTWGIPRPTYDADVAVVADDARLASLFKNLEEAGFGVPDEHRRGWVDTVGGMGKVKVTRFEGR
jgi:nitrous oxidase accessory protein NosD